MPADNNLIVAIELGSSKVTGVVGQKQPDGAISVKAVVQKSASTFMRKGRIHNLPKTQSVISDIKQELERKLKKQIVKVYVGVGGMGLHTEGNKVSREFDERAMVTDDVIEGLYEENMKKQLPERVILETIPQNFKLGPNNTLEPVGVQTDSIEASFLNIVTKKEVTDNINKCFLEAGLQSAEKPITFLALANEVLTSAQRRSGCVFVDMGAETTSVAIFKNNILRHLAVIPLGGSNITKDIASLQVDELEAEYLKIEYGVALSEEDLEDHDPIKLHGGDHINYAEFIGLVEARQEEIIANIVEQISESPYDQSQLIGGIIITGGASNMRGLDKAFLKHTGFDKEKIYFEKNLKTQFHGDTAFKQESKTGNYNGVLALLSIGEEDCMRNEQPAPQPVQEDPEEVARRIAEEKRREEERINREAEERAQKLYEERKRQEEEERLKKEAEEEESHEKKEKGKGFGSRFYKGLKSFTAKLLSDEDKND